MGGSSSSGGDRFHRGTSKAKFDILTGKGLTQASGQNVNTDFNQSVAGALKKDYTVLKRKSTGKAGVEFGQDKFKFTETAEEFETRRKKDEERRENYFQEISQKELTTLVSNFKQRQSSLISRSQIQGRKQLILTDR